MKRQAANYAVALLCLAGLSVRAIAQQQPAAFFKTKLPGLEFLNVLLNRNRGAFTQELQRFALLRESSGGRNTPPLKK